MKKLLCVLLASTYASSFAIGTAASSNLSLSGTLANSCSSSFGGGGAISFVNFTYGAPATAGATYQLTCNPTATLTSVIVTSTNNGALVNGANNVPYAVNAVVSGGAPSNVFASDWTPTTNPVTVNTGTVAFESGVPGTVITANLTFNTPNISSSIPAGNYTDTYSVNANY